MIDRLPDAQMLDADPQGWALARSVRDSGTIVDFVRSTSTMPGAGWSVGREVNWSAVATGNCGRVHDGTLPLYRPVVETGQLATRSGEEIRIPGRSALGEDALHDHRASDGPLLI